MTPRRGLVAGCGDGGGASPAAGKSAAANYPVTVTDCAVVGGDHHRLLPVSELFGALLLVVADIVCRTAMDTQELPVGVVTSLIGALALLYLLDRRLGSGS